VSDFTFLKNALTKRWVISAPRRAKRPDVAESKVLSCPFCHNHEKAIWQIGEGDSWQVKVVNNKYPFAPIHELVIHSPEHTKNFEKLPIRHIVLILVAYRHRYNEHSRHGQVFIFHNRGRKAGESLLHPHTQITVIPDEVYLDIPPLQSVIGDMKNALSTDHFKVFCPEKSQWPDEVWVAPKRLDAAFGEISDDEIDDLAHILFSLVTIFDLRYEHDFPFNFYISPGNHWYLRLTPRKKTLGGFEVGTGVMVNTQKPSETIDFIKIHFDQPDIARILKEHRADYHKRV
jgi:UDPglucose--hexose-1-phosphate uridylyltransferase